MHSDSSTLRIVEVFGPTIQGEGPFVGRAAHFLRLADCNLTCQWCDTAFSWDHTRSDPDRPRRDVAIGELLSSLDPRTSNRNAAEPAVRRLVVTGGEPLLQAVELAELLHVLLSLQWVVEVETSGSVPPGPVTDLVNHFNVSPKLAHSGVPLRARIRRQVLNQFAEMHHAAFKFVVEADSDLNEIELILDSLSVPIEPDRIFVMAQGVSSGEVLHRSRNLAEAVASRGWALTPRWHTLLWEEQRGR